MFYISSKHWKKKQGTTKKEKVQWKIKPCSNSKTVIAKDKKSNERWERGKERDGISKRKNTFSNLPYLNPKLISFYIQAAGGRSSVAKQAHSSVTIFPLWNWGRDEERIAVFPISLVLLVTLIHLTGLLISIFPYHFSTHCLRATNRASYIIVGVLNNCLTINKGQAPN